MDARDVGAGGVGARFVVRGARSLLVALVVLLLFLVFFFPLALLMFDVVGGGVRWRGRRVGVSVFGVLRRVLPVRRPGVGASLALRGAPARRRRLGGHVERVPFIYIESLLLEGVVRSVLVANANPDGETREH